VNCQGLFTRETLSLPSVALSLAGIPASLIGMIAQLEDLGARYNSHALSCVACGLSESREGVVFSVGEAEGKELYDRPLLRPGRTWSSAARTGGVQPRKKLQLIEVQYDPLLEESLIEELLTNPSHLVTGGGRDWPAACASTLSNCES